MLIRFEAPDGSIEQVSEEPSITGAIPRAIVGPEGCYWLSGVRIDREHGYLPVYRLAREVSSALH